MSCIETEFFKEMRKVDKAVKGFDGYERAIKICEYFEDQGEHPHPKYTFRQMAMNRTSDYSFPSELKKEMSYLVASNRILELDSKVEPEQTNKKRRRKNKM
ncbi:hypothetical protein [Vibrio sp. 1CM23M]|uniref:hypothetical protein n=1 Tax=Vibrio sp. 1CM23M TaxID=2929164 RepID=UPI0020BEE3E6|nr:hypothetical protein [Vibrio sp. 1CM23M]MCK8072425.1 hypothetical protein [Vibrio sp. 1CM23M]